MKIAMLAFAVALAGLASGCATQNEHGAASYGPSQGYRAPFGAPYGGAGPGPTLSLDKDIRVTPATMGG
jgi:hypothetical protein